MDPERASNVPNSLTNSAWAAGELAGGLVNPQHLKLLSDRSDLYRHLITLAFTQHGPAQQGFAADDLNELSAADQLHAAPIRAEKELFALTTSWRCRHRCGTGWNVSALPRQLHRIALPTTPRVSTQVLARRTLARLDLASALACRQARRQLASFNTRFPQGTKPGAGKKLEVIVHPKGVRSAPLC
jgi:hypothetical protein